ncbi:SpoIID/LytB domain-containing protein|uniref:Stage II sporulation protein D n=1 Tax=Dendrosporobacter quercicolus TaxID=146817 RepID=A0A1G9UU27_9FIRM|nr:SpoIID/LytB domain-containing protein [Dendrosporobacter quercicolus]NSL48028.1 SpoIID/LytB domain-containing protein [Dendrosporobacter quercicolus DSM 1736]SDM63386.1 stage II sporulation protein D [Dendrosporobacter quercicolus]
MLKNKNVNYAIIAVILVLAVAGAYALLRPPAPKPAPPAPMEQAPQTPGKTVEPIPGVPQFDVGKYKAEPTVTVWRADKGTIESMSMEKYIEGVIAQEMQPEWPVEALAAQAIASRTLTVNAIEAGTIRRLHNADVSTAKEELQAFAPEKVNDNVREAVRRTRGQILLYGGGLVNAIYSSCNGQIAATKEESFPKEIPHPAPYFQPVKDNCFAYAPDNIKSWTVKIPGTEVAAAVGYNGRPGDIKILEKGPSGRILYIGAGSQKVYGAEFRKAVGFDRLKSTLITDMIYDGKDFTFKGLGWGNGVGLCQWGAYTFAKQGKDFQEILTHYYTDAEVVKLYQ